MSDPFAPPTPGQTRVCPNCYSNVPLGTPICPACNTVLPVPTPGYQTIPPTYPTIPPTGAPKKSQTGLIVGIILVVLVVAGVLAYAGFVAYQNEQARVLQTAEQTDATNAPNKLQFTCFTGRQDNSTLSWDSLNRRYVGYEMVYDSYGLSNPTRYAMDISWTLTIDIPSANLNLVGSSTAFHISANGVARTTFTFQLTASQLNQVPRNADFSRYTATLNGTYSVTGSYGVYTVPVSSTSYSSTNSGSLPAC